MSIPIINKLVEAKLINVDDREDVKEERWTEGEHNARKGAAKRCVCYEHG